MKPKTLKLIITYKHPCGENYPQYSRERDCKDMIKKPCIGCMYNLNRRSRK